MNIDFPRYLLSKYYLDFRSLHHTTLACLYSNLEKINRPPQILELGGGIGSMFTYFVHDKFETEFDYTLIDKSEENIRFIPDNVKFHSNGNGFIFEDCGNHKYRVSNGESICQLQTTSISTEEFINSWNKGPEFDIILASSYLDIVPVPETLRLLQTVLKPVGILYLPLNYDGLTLFHPVVDRQLDDEIVALYNLSMDNRRIDGLQTGGSLTGRKLLDWLPEAGYEIVCAGSSDWCLLPVKENYRGDEGYFLECILQFVEDSVSPLWKDKPEILENWLALRRRQIIEGKLSYLAHQLDYMARR